jgi:DNA-binding transcriptional regulator YiaG
VNIWREFSDTKPFETLNDVFNAYYSIKLGRPRKPHDKKAEGRPHINLTAEQLKQIRAADKTVTHAALAKQYGLSVSTVKRLRQTKTL